MIAGGRTRESSMFYIELETYAIRCRHSRGEGIAKSAMQEKL
jgi:hypothetical protein